VLGAIVERGFGKAFDAAVEEGVFRPAGMARTSYYPVASGTARGYTHKRPGSSLDAPPDPDHWYPAWEAGTSGNPVANPMGGGFSTADDLVRFGEAFMQGRLLNHQTLKRVRNTSARRRTTAVETVTASKPA